MDPDVLKSVLGLSKLPEAETCFITGFTIKMWGIYPTLVPSDETDVKITGTFWKVSNSEQVMRLSAYESKAYTTTQVTIFPDYGEPIENGQAFCWAGDPNSSDLDHGSFDLIHYQKYFKKSLLRHAERPI